jgi:serine protease Do
MNHGIVIRLAGVEQPATRILHQEVITIGTAPDCDIIIGTDSPALPPESVIITLRWREGAYRITTIEPMAGVTRDGEGIAVGEALRDGDTFFLGATGIRLRFFAITDNEEITESLRLGSAVLATARTTGPLTATKDATTAPAARRRRSIPRTDVAIVFVKQLLRELVAEVPRRWLYAVVGLIVFLILGFVYFNVLNLVEGRRNNKAITELKEGINDTRQQIDEMRAELQRAREEQLSIRGALALPQTIVSNYGQGVCLIYGSYTFTDPRVGRDVRFKEAGRTDNPIGPNGEVNLAADGSGPVYEIEFMGTGFLADKGLILTNRHVVQAWEEDDIASLIKMRGFRPKLRELLAYFPQVNQPFTLRPIEMMPEQDVALCGFEQAATELPILPLETDNDTIASGQQVVLLGYPSGLEGLLARADRIGRTGTRNFGNVSYRSQLNELAASGKIKPQSTQGHISDTAPQLVYDARTDEGGSGGPVFGAHGKVVGINQAIFLNTQATTNFGVPIRYGLELLKKHQTAPQQSALSGGTNNQPKS